MNISELVEKKEIIPLVIIIIGVALAGLFNISMYGLYLFGMAFFFSGYFIGLYEKKFGLIFMFTHCLSGYAMLLFSLIPNITSNPIMTDKPISLTIMLASMLISAVAGYILIIIYNLGNKLNTKTYVKLIPLFLFLISLILAGIVHLKYGINI